MSLIRVFGGEGRYLWAGEPVPPNGMAIGRPAGREAGPDDAHDEFAVTGAFGGGAGLSEGALHALQFMRGEIDAAGDDLGLAGRAASIVFHGLLLW